MALDVWLAGVDGKADYAATPAPVGLEHADFVAIFEPDRAHGRRGSFVRLVDDRRDARFGAGEIASLLRDLRSRRRDFDGPAVSGERLDALLALGEAASAAGRGLVFEAD